MLLLAIIIIGIITVTTTFFFVWGLRIWAERKRFYDIPNERSSHTWPTPRGGGLAIALVTLAGAWLLFTLRFSVINPFLISFIAAVKGGGLEERDLLSFTLGGALIAGVSWIDDLRTLPNRVRFAIHVLAAVIVITISGYWETIDLPFIGAIRLGWLSLPLVFIWIVGLTNAYNFMDGIDGIAGGQGVIAGLGWLALGILAVQPLIATLGLLIASGCLGFLGHNWPPARIFMGDVGSAFLGFSFSIMALIAGRTAPGLILAGTLLVWPFIFDTIYTFLRRLRHRENVFAAHRSHLYQRLVISGFSHRTVTLIYILLALLGGFAAVSIQVGWLVASLVSLALIIIAALSLWRFTAWREKGRRPNTAVESVQTTQS